MRERLERELLSNSYANATIILNLKHANRYFPTIERILAENNIPEDFKYLAVAESNFRQGTSSAGAKGFWQFMPATAKGYGLEVNSNIDERMNLEKATYAACRLLQDYKNKFGKDINKFYLCITNFKVVVITTKKGRYDSPTEFTYRSQLGFSEPRKAKFEMMNS